MPFDPVALGNQMIAAGQKEATTGGKLQQAAVKLRASGDLLKTGGRIQTSINSVRDGLQSIRSLLGPVVTALQFIVNTLNGITVPTITPQFTTINFPVIGRIRFVTGITIGSAKPFTTIATRVDTVRANVATIRDTL